MIVDQHQAQVCNVRSERTVGEWEELVVRTTSEDKLTEGLLCLDDRFQIALVLESSRASILELSIVLLFLSDKFVTLDLTEVMIVAQIVGLKLLDHTLGVIT